MTLADRFWSRVDRSGGPTACWPWTGRLDDEGYGHFYESGKNHRAHRFACALIHGEPPSSDLQSCHDPNICSSRACCNGAHLRWDTSAGNQADVAIVGSRRGEKNPKAVLTPDLVRAIWARRHEGPTAISIALGVSRESVKHVVWGYNWRHITGAARGSSWRQALPILLIALTLSATGCESSTEWGACIPVDRSHERTDRDYRISVRNAILGVVFVETIFAPIIVLASETYCPVGPAVRP